MVFMSEYIGLIIATAKTPTKTAMTTMRIGSISFDMSDVA